MERIVDETKNDELYKVVQRKDQSIGNHDGMCYIQETHMGESENPFYGCCMDEGAESIDNRTH